MSCSGKFSLRVRESDIPHDGNSEKLDKLTVLTTANIFHNDEIMQEIVKKLKIKGIDLKISPKSKAGEKLSFVMSLDLLSEIKNIKWPVKVTQPPKASGLGM